MKYNIRGDKMLITDAIKDYTETKLGRLEKYFKDDDITANVLAKVRGNSQIVEVTIPTSKFILRSEEESDDLYAAIDLVSDKLERQIRKNKTRLNRNVKDNIKEFNFDFDIKEEEEPKEKIVKRKDIEMKPMDEEEAILEMELLGHSFFVYKDMSFKDLGSVLIDSSISTATILMMVGLSKSSSYVVTVSGLPEMILSGFASFTDSPIVILLLINVLFLIIGMLMEANAAIVMMTPLLLPLMKAFGIDIIQFGIVMSFNMCIGLITPPVGICMLMGNQLAGSKLSAALKAVAPMLLMSLIILMLITYIPALTTWLPGFLAE